MTQNNPTITIVDTAPYHLRALAEVMSQDSINTARKLGITPLKALWSSYRNSLYCKTAFIDGRIAAIWGISGTMLAEVGRPWLVMSPETKEYPLRVAFRYRKELNNMLKLFPVLEDYVPEDNEPSIRLLELMGFKVSKNTILVCDAIFRRAERRA